jgi:hypothetical protein
VPTVSRLESAATHDHPGHQHSAGPAEHETPGVVVTEAMAPGVAASGVVQRSASADPPSTAPAPGPASHPPLPVAPLLGDTAPDGPDAAGTSVTGDGATPGNDAPGVVAEVGHRPMSQAGPATAPDAYSVPATHSSSSITDHAHVVQRSATSAPEPAFQPTSTASSSFSFGSASASVQRLPGLGAPLVSGPPVPGPVADRPVPQRLPSDQPLTVADRSGPTGTTVRSSTAGVDHDVPAVEQRPAGAGPAPAEHGAAAETHDEAPMLGFAELMRVIDEGSLSGAAPTTTTAPTTATAPQGPMAPT